MEARRVVARAAKAAGGGGGGGGVAVDGLGWGECCWARWRVEVVRARWEGVRGVWRCGRFNGDREGGGWWARVCRRSARMHDAQTEDAAIVVEQCNARGWK